MASRVIKCKFQVIPLISLSRSLRAKGQWVGLTGEMYDCFCLMALLDQNLFSLRENGRIYATHRAEV